MKYFSAEVRTALANSAVTVVDMQGELDTYTAVDFEQILNYLFSTGKYKIVLNLEKLTYISSAGFGILMSIIRNVRKHQGDIKISHIRPDVYTVFELLELPGLFHILRTEADAVDDFH